MRRNDYPLSKSENIVIQETDGDLLIYDLTTNQVYCLNETSAIVWKSCDGEKSVEDIAQNLSREMKAKVDEDVVWLSLKELESVNLLVNPTFENKFAGLSRRQIIKNIGFASLIALPLISSVVAPSSISAKSVQTFCGCTPAGGLFARDEGCPCLFNSDCCGVCSGQADPNGNPVLLPNGDPLLLCSGPTPAAQMNAASCCRPFP